MNPFEYKNFQDDMKTAVSDFVNSSDYKIISLTENSLKLSNGIKIISFYLEATSLVSEICNIDGSNLLAIYQIFLNENKFACYPVDKENKFSYEEWNKYKVMEILKHLKNDFPHYL